MRKKEKDKKSHMEHLSFEIVCSLATRLRIKIPTAWQLTFSFFLLQTKNILVKTDGTCCIADLGLAISRPKPDSKELENIEPKVKRIMTCNFASYR